MSYQDLYKSIVSKLSDVFVQILLGFLSLVFVLPAGFILFQYPPEITTLRKDILEFDATRRSHGKTLEQVRAMGNVLEGGWFSNDQTQKKLVAILDRILFDLRADNLEAGFVAESVLWLYEAEAQLVRERGRIKGYTFQDETHKSFQAHLVKAFDARIGFIKQLAELLSSWNMYAYDERTRRLGELRINVLGVLETIPAFYSFIDQETVRAIEENEKIGRKVAHFREMLANLERKRWLALWTFLLGLIILAASVVWVVLKLKSRSTASGPD